MLKKISILYQLNERGIVRAFKKYVIINIQKTLTTPFLIAKTFDMNTILRNQLSYEIIQKKTL